MTLGIGIITFRRLHALARTVQQVVQHTKSPYQLLVADDGSADKTVEWCLQNQITAITGKNHGVCWNKNRALFTFMQYSDADPILLLEDDCYPVEDGWEDAWIKAAKLVQHINFANPDWPAGWCRGGEGTPEKPWVSREITGLATATTREALIRVGYLNSAFRGYGYGHIEWTERFCKAGYIHENTVPCIRCGLVSEDKETFRNKEEVRRNYRLAISLRLKPFNYCPPWQTPDEKKELEEEVRQGISRIPLDRRLPLEAKSLSSSETANAPTKPP